MKDQGDKASGVASPKIWWGAKKFGGTKCLILGD